MKSANPPADTTTPADTATRDNNWKPKASSKTPLLAQLGRPIVWIARGLAWLTEPEEAKGRGKIEITGKVLLFSAGMVYAYGLTTESLLVLLNAGTSEIYGSGRVAEDVRFVPKLGVSDGAQLGRVLPSPLKLVRLSSNFAFGWVPGYRAFGNTSFDNYLVWADPNFYIALVGAAVSGILQAKAIRSVSIKVRKARLDRVRKYRVDDLSPRALAIAKIRNAEFQYAEVDNYIFDGLVIVTSYVFEIGCFLVTFEHSGSTVVFLLLNGVIEVFGFESCYKLTGLTDLEDEEVQA
ncbi:hypothetical protein [Pseudanabaena sp. FACHB-2040]|uniref:hypothetical protein n=1 Tax=Pseudanabaena sp. FACHB-2040 TaxID=2692859 RepID=UPI00168964B8|nr:hypothetical protein [Pseudanabaena sp. FACHB-2040]MBD2261392.1 hypothetical protein [Pseudanabaena sp. FACHB-2040]